MCQSNQLHKQACIINLKDEMQIISAWYLNYI